MENHYKIFPHSTNCGKDQVYNEQVYNVLTYIFYAVISFDPVVAILETIPSGSCPEMQNLK